LYQQVKITHPELYDLAHDPGEKRDIASQEPDKVRRLLAFADRARAELGDSLTAREGNGVRPAGRLANSGLLFQLFQR
jgi:arylsulfatase A